MRFLEYSHFLSSDPDEGRANNLSGAAAERERAQAGATSGWAATAGGPGVEAPDHTLVSAGPAILAVLKGSQSQFRYCLMV